MEPIPYTTTEERVTLADGVTEGKRMRARSACASATGRWAWMNVNVCVSRLGGKAPPRITSSRDLVAFLFDVFPITEQHREHFMIVCCDAKNQPVGVSLVSVGGLAESMVDMKVMFKPALLLPAMAIALCHNHPSNVAEPSAEDLQLTDRIMKAGELLGVRVLDHVILTDTREKYFSFVDAGLMRRG